MSFFYQALVEIDTHLQELEVRWALLGGLAVSLRAEPRTTQDIDIAVAVVGDREAEKVILDVKARGYRLRCNPLERTDMDRLSTVLLSAPLELGFVKIDFLFASSGIESEIIEAAERLNVLPGVALPVITMGHLLAVKTLANRPKDVVDIISLLPFATTKDLQVAREALDLISRRGFDEGLDLQMEFSRHLETFDDVQSKQSRHGIL